jgi:pilus assembly protein CpaE
VDILLAPPRPEMAEMVSTRDVDKVLSLLRRVYGVVLIDTPSGLSEVVLSFLDHSDVVLQVVNQEATTIHNTRAAMETFRAMGYPTTKIHYLLNRADPAGMDPKKLQEALGKAPEFALSSDGHLVVDSNNQGMPFVLAQPEAVISKELTRIAASLAGATAVPAGARR